MVRVACQRYSGAVSIQSPRFPTEESVLSTCNTCFYHLGSASFSYLTGSARFKEHRFFPLCLADVQPSSKAVDFTVCSTGESKTDVSNITQMN